MFMNPLPPQAYTKDTLVQAYAWLQTQSPSIKELATNPDILVSLYMKSKTQGEQFFERPSIQNFKNELKNLAGMMGELDSPSGSHQQTTVISHSQVTQPSFSNNPSIGLNASHSAAATVSTLSMNHFSGSHLPNSLYQNASPVQNNINSSLQHTLENPIYSPSESRRENTFRLDEKSLQMIQEVKHSLNLTSDQEVLRLLLALGYHKATQIVK